MYIKSTYKKSEKILTKEKIKCIFCKGRGKYKVYNKSTLKFDNITCKYCNGEGKRFGVTYGKSKELS